MSEPARELQYQDDEMDIRGQSQFIETRVIQPVAPGGNAQAGGGQLRFMLPTTGIMDRDAYLKFQLLGPNMNQFLPIFTGGYCAIETATLYCGGKQIAQTRGCAHLMTMMNFYRTPCDRNQKQAIRMGQFNGLMVDGTLGNALPGHWGMDTNYEWCTTQGGPAPYYLIANPVNDRAIAPGYVLTNDAQTTPEFRLYIADLFPLLFANTLPLGLIDNNFSIELDLTQDQVRGQRSIGTAANVWVTGTNVIHASLHVDLIFYDDPINEPTTMDKLRATLNKGQQLVFTDSQYVLRNQPAAAAPGVLQELNVLLGLDHQIVRNVLIAQPDAINYAAAPAVQGNALTGVYTSVGSTSVNTLQLTINSVPVYPNPIDTDAKIWNELSQVFPEPFNINPAIASYVGQVNAAGALVPAAVRTSNKTLFGVGHTFDNLLGHSFYRGMNLSKTYDRHVIGAGTAIGRSPVVLTIQDARTGGVGLEVPKLLHIWINCERLMSIVGGQIMVTGS